MRKVLWIESAVQGVLVINGSFCGPLDGQGQAFPAGDDAEIYIQFFPFAQAAAPLTARLELRGGRLARLEPEEACYALLWPDGLIQLELRAQGAEQAQEMQTAQEETAAAGALLRYLTMRLAGDAQARTWLMNPQDEPDLPAYDAVVPMRFAPMNAPERFDERAGLVRRLSANVARVDAALAVTTPAGRGHRLIEHIKVLGA